MHKAVGDQLVCVFVDHGLLRKDERRAGRGGLRRRDRRAPRHGRRRASSSSTRSPASATRRPKRKIIGREFIRTFEQAQADLVAEAAADGDPIRFLVQGTLYPDVVESGGGTGTANIKSHHNVGGLPEDLQFELVEPLRTLFKDEVRAIGRELGPARGHRRPPAVPRARASASASSARSPASASSCCATRMRSCAPS